MEAGMFEKLAKWSEYELGHVLISKKLKKDEFYLDPSAFGPVDTRPWMAGELLGLH